MLEDRLLNLSAGGLYNGLMILVDDETGTYWDHLTGKALLGPLLGSALPVWPLEVTTVGMAKKREPGLEVSLSPHGLWAWQRWMTRVWSHGLLRWAPLPLPFRRTFEGKRDRRRPEMEPGLGVVVGRRQRFYPLQELANGVLDSWGDRVLVLGLGEDRVPSAAWQVSSERPFQMLTRWYGFSRTYPECEVFGRRADDRDGEGELESGLPLGSVQPRSA